MITLIGSLKGGTGKSTVSFNLSIWLLLAEQSVCLLDLDPQATLSDVAELRQEERYTPKLSVVGREKLTVDLRDFPGEVLIDVGTADLEAMKEAICLADRILVPVPPSQADIWSTQRFLRLIKKACNGQTIPDVKGFINRGDTHHAVRETDETAAALVALPGIGLIKPRLLQRTIYRRSFSEGLAVFELDPRAKAAREFTSLCAAVYPDLLK